MYRETYIYTCIHVHLCTHVHLLAVFPKPVESVPVLRESSDRPCFVLARLLRPGTHNRKPHAGIPQLEQLGPWASKGLLGLIWYPFGIPFA